MLPVLKAVLSLLSLLQLISSSPAPPQHRQMLLEVTRKVRQLSSGVQVPCNDTRVPQVPFTKKLPYTELLCQAANALGTVSRCRKDYEPLVTNLRRLQGTTTCCPSSDNEIYLRHFLPELGNFTQRLNRRWGWAQ